MALDLAASFGKVLELLEIPGCPGAFALGSFSRYITVYSQQARAVNLILALRHAGRLKEETSVVVIGAGASGLTAALAAAQYADASVTILERQLEPLTKLLNGTHRFIHPHIYDWPRSEVSGDQALLPLLNWKAGFADDVAGQILREWDQAIGRGSLRITPSYSVQDVSVAFQPEGGRYVVTWNGEESANCTGRFHVVIFAVGFGEEPDSEGQDRYWEPDKLDSIKTNQKTWLVAGSGDGGLIDLMRLCIHRFRHDQMVKSFASAEDARAAGEVLFEAEQRHRAAGDDVSLHQEYEKLHVKSIKNALHKNRRKDTVVSFTCMSPGKTYASRSSILNRLLVSQLAHINLFKYLPGPVEILENKPGSVSVRFSNGKEKTFNNLVRRFGAEASFNVDFPLFSKACAPLKAVWDTMPQHEDVTRKRLWEEGEGPSTGAIPAASIPRPPGFRLVAFDLDGTLIQGDDFEWSWKLVWAKLGFPDDLRRGYMRQYLDGSISYEQWCDQTAGHFREAGLHRDHIREIAQQLRPTRYLSETIRDLKQAGLKLMIVSGGIDSLIDEVFPEQKRHFDRIHINHFDYDEAGYFTGVRSTPFDFEGKFVAVADYCRELGIEASQAVFVGDGFNDEDVVQRVGLSIGYSPRTQLLKDLVTWKIYEDDLRKILPYILPPLDPAPDAHVLASSENSRPASKTQGPMRGRARR